MAFHGHVCLPRRHDEHVAPWSRPRDHTRRQLGTSLNPFFRLGWNLLKSPLQSVYFKQAHKFIVGDVEYLKVEKLFDQPQTDHSKKGSLTKFYSDEATLGVTWHGCWLLVHEGLRHHCQTPDLLAPLPTANGQGTVILSVCKNHPKCAAQGKRKGWMGLSRRPMVLDAMRESDS